MSHSARIIITLHSGETIEVDGNVAFGSDGLLKAALPPDVAKETRRVLQEDEVQRTMRAAGPVAARISSGGYYSVDRAAPVSRITKAHICVERRNGVGAAYETKYRRNGGQEVGADSYFGGYIVNLDELNALAEANGGTWKRTEKVKG